MSEPKQQIGLALSGGGARGFFHCGVIDGLLDHELRPDVIVGTSAGAMAGALVAAGVSMQDAIATFPSNIRSLILDATSWKSLSIQPMKALHDYLHPLLGELRFDDLSMKLYITAVDAGRGRLHVFGQHNELLIDAVKASCAIPGILNFMDEDQNLYFDGGLFQNLPADIIREKVDYLIGVDLFPFHERTYARVPSKAAILRRTSDLLHAHHTREQRVLCDVVISPRRLIKYQTYRLSNKSALYELGYQTVVELLEKGRLDLDES